MWAFTYADPYEEYQQKIDENLNKDSLGQLNLDMDLKINLRKSSIQLKERPYMSEKFIELEINLISLVFEETTLKGRHKTQPNLDMLMT
jgi:hypothetical protein